MKKIVIDAGHGGSDSGAVGNNLFEKNLTLEISRKVRDYIESVSNVKVMMTRDTDVFVSLSGRASYANRQNPDAFISIHINSASSASATGYETFHYPSSTKGRKFAQAVHPKVSKYWRADRGIKTANFAVLRQTNAPAILLELGFIVNKSDMDILRRNMDNIAKDIAEGILDYLGVKKIANTKEEPKKEEQVKQKEDITNHWAKDNIERVKDLGIMHGFEDGDFKPDEPVTRAQLATAITRFIDKFDLKVKDSGK